MPETSQQSDTDRRKPGTPPASEGCMAQEIKVIRLDEFPDLND